MSKIYYWANNTKKNSGEGILALNFLSLLKKKYKNYSFIKLNSFTHKENFFYNYILPIFGVFRLWKFHIKGKKVSRKLNSLKKKIIMFLKISI